MTDLLDYFREKIEEMEKEGYTPEEIERRLDSTVHIQELVVKALL